MSVLIGLAGGVAFIVIVLPSLLGSMYESELKKRGRSPR